MGVQEEGAAPVDLGHWKCQTCGQENIPFSSECSSCAINRFSLEYMPSQKRFYHVLQSLSDLGPTSQDTLKTQIGMNGLSKVLHRLGRGPTEERGQLVTKD